MVGVPEEKKKETGSNIILIGLPSAGKSMAGVLLAKRAGFRFVDVDLLIQEQYGKLLSEIIAEDGLEGFLEIENRVNAGIREHRAVIAPGGSVIYGEDAMRNYKEQGIVVYLKISYEEMLRRIGDVTKRGVALRDGMTLRDMVEERIPYFERYADECIDETGRSIDEVVEELQGILEKRQLC